MQCPICVKRQLHRKWETVKSRTWTGEWECPKCGKFHMSGIFRDSKGSREVVYWHPACEKCGLDYVVPVGGEGLEGVFICHKCGSRFAIEGRTLVRYSSPRRKNDGTIGTGAVVMWDGIAATDALKTA